MPRGRGARLLGRAAGSSGTGTARGRPLGAGEPRAAPKPVCGLAETPGGAGAAARWTP